jgi:hypothetical protein
MKIMAVLVVVGCGQIFLGKAYQNGGKIPNDHKMYQMAITFTTWPKIYQMAIKYTNIFHYKTLQNVPKMGFFV